jgi:hypothetical protein
MNKYKYALKEMPKLAEAYNSLPEKMSYESYCKIKDKLALMPDYLLLAICNSKSIQYVSHSAWFELRSRQKSSRNAFFAKGG